MTGNLLRSLPSIETLLERPLASRISMSIGRSRVRDLLRQITDALRQDIAQGKWPNGDGSPVDEIERRLDAVATNAIQSSLRRVINATGVILHTNLGRAPLAPSAAATVTEAASGYTNLEYDLSRGERGSRESHCNELLSHLVGSESAVVTNNNAAAVLLILNTLAEGGEVIVSRGELIEIGGSFRIPDVMAKSGAILREVGTTNRTRIADYQQAISDRTRLILRVHPSNYRIVGFTERPSAVEIAELAGKAGVPSFEDLGSGCLVDLAGFGVKDEPVVAESLKAGISVVSFSGDKMLGGPQAGVIAGSAEILTKIRRNPLMRALRVDKMTYAALESTLRLYQREVAATEVPVIRMIATGSEELRDRALNLKDLILNSTHGEFTVSLEDGWSVIGGGSAPEIRLPTVLLSIQHGHMSETSLEEALRRHTIPIITRTERDRVLIDLRTVASDEEPIIVKALEVVAQLGMTNTASVNL